MQAQKFLYTFGCVRFFSDESPCFCAKVSIMHRRPKRLVYLGFHAHEYILTSFRPAVDRQIMNTSPTILVKPYLMLRYGPF